jgi:hypothetical protein
MPHRPRLGRTPRLSSLRGFGEAGDSAPRVKEHHAANDDQRAQYAHELSLGVMHEGARSRRAAAFPASSSLLLLGARSTPLLAPNFFARCPRVLHHVQHRVVQVAPSPGLQHVTSCHVEEVCEHRPVCLLLALDRPAVVGFRCGRMDDGARRETARACSRGRDGNLRGNRTPNGQGDSESNLERAPGRAAASARLPLLGGRVGSLVQHPATAPALDDVRHRAPPYPGRQTCPLGRISGRISPTTPAPRSPPAEREPRSVSGFVPS